MVGCVYHSFVMLKFQRSPGVSVCWSVSSPPFIRVRLRLSVWAPPLQLPYFIRSHQLSSVLDCQESDLCFLVSPPFALCFCNPVLSFSYKLSLKLTRALHSLPDFSLRQLTYPSFLLNFLLLLLWIVFSPHTSPYQTFPFLLLLFIPQFDSSLKS